MVDISRIARIVSGVARNIDLSAAGNALHVDSLKVGNTSPVELTKAILTNLIALQNGSDFSTGTNAHTHDGRYFTETELGATSGATLVGAAASATNYTPSASTVAGHLAGIDSALATAGSDTFEDDVFRINNAATPTKQIAFSAAGITAANTRTITMPDANVNLADANNAVLKDGSRAMTGNLNMGSQKIINLANGVAGSDAVNLSQLQAVQSLISNFEWQESVLDRLATPPGSPSTGDRYLVVSAATGNWTAHEDDIAEWDGSAWVFTTPTTGTYVSVDDETDGIYEFGGSSWTKKQFEATTASDGLTKVGVDVRIAADGVTTAKIASGAVTDAKLATDSVTTAKIASGAVTDTKLAADSVTTAKILDANVTAAKLAADSVTTAKILDANVTNAKLAANSVTATKFASDELVAGLGTDASSKLMVKGAFAELTNKSGGSITAGSIATLGGVTANSFVKANASTLAGAQGTIGVVLATTADDAVGKVQLSGIATVIKEGGGSLTLGQRVYLATTAGEVTHTAPGQAGGSGVTDFLIGIACATDKVVLQLQLVSSNE